MLTAWMNLSLLQLAATAGVNTASSVLMVFFTNILYAEGYQHRNRRDNFTHAASKLMTSSGILLVPDPAMKDVQYNILRGLASPTPGQWGGSLRYALLRKRQRRGAVASYKSRNGRQSVSAMKPASYSTSVARPDVEDASRLPSTPQRHHRRLYVLLGLCCFLLIIAVIVSVLVAVESCPALSQAAVSWLSCSSALIVSSFACDEIMARIDLCVPGSSRSSVDHVPHARGCCPLLL